MGWGGQAALWGAVALAGLAVASVIQARRAERRNPPRGRFLSVDGVRLRYVDQGSGPPVVLLHGNQSLIEDFELSLMAPLARHYRVVAFDRPGFGYSDRPRHGDWRDPGVQARLLRDAWRQLGIERPVVLGHSWAAMVAMALAIHHPEDVAWVVVESGYYYPKFRPDLPVVMLATLPVLGPVLRHTVWPLSLWLLGRLQLKAMFSPNPIPSRAEDFPFALVVRPSQIRASVEDGAYMRAAARGLHRHYGEVRVPVVILAGTADKFADPARQSMRLSDDVPGALLYLVPTTGHMLHHARIEDALRAIDEAWRLAVERGRAAPAEIAHRPDRAQGAGRVSVSTPA